MQDVNQKTLLKSVKFEGVGLHSGVIAKVNILPAEDNHGIVFKRTDLKDNNIIKSDFKEVSSAKLCTTLKNKFGTSISTIEHLMAAFYITGIDNVMVEINNPEIPIMDGSAIDFVNLINKAGLKRLHTKRKFLKILKKVEFKDGKKYISIEPNKNNFEVDFQLGYNNKIIGNQKNHVIFERQDLKEIYSSRTFCLFEDIELIKKSGLAKGGSLENAIVVKGEKILNEKGLRNNKEFVNHKILDLVGDFLLAGRILGNVKCIQGGHHLSNIFLREVFKDPSNFEEVTCNFEFFEKNFKIPINKLAVSA
jgi:UDP-3-O-[3-hydroxymyristoyl] N-acetylglucosamine deacetylase